jgi:hypothetical protein
MQCQAAHHDADVGVGVGAGRLLWYLLACLALLSTQVTQIRLNFAPHPSWVAAERRVHVIDFWKLAE